MSISHAPVPRAAVLRPVLFEQDLPPAELWSARLDGELFRLGDSFVTVDQPVSAQQRAAAVGAALESRLNPRRVILERETAAWVHGVLPSLPEPYRLCVSSQARARPADGTGIQVREVLIAGNEIVLLAGIRVTTALRTAIDIVRAADAFEQEQRDAVRALLAAAGVSVEECRRELAGRRNLPGKRLTLQRLATLDG